MEEVEEEEEGCGELGSLCCAIFSCLAIDLEYLKPQALHRLNQSLALFIVNSFLFTFYDQRGPYAIQDLIEYHNFGICTDGLLDLNA